VAILRQVAVGSWGSPSEAVFSSAPLVGSLLIACTSERSGGSAGDHVVTGDDWVHQVANTTAQSDGSYRRSASVFFKVAGVSEPVSFTCDDGTFNTMRLTIFEYELEAGEDQWVLLDSDFADDGATSNGSTIDIGATVSVSAGRMFVWGCVVSKNGSGIDNPKSVSYSNGLTSDYAGERGYFDMSHFAASANDGVTGIKTSIATQTGSVDSSGLAGAILVFSTVLAASVTIGGSLATGAGELDIVGGGGFLTLTLTGDEWVTAGATFDAVRADIRAGISASLSPVGGWNDVVRDAVPLANITRSGDGKTINITLPAFAGYSISVSDVIDGIAIPASALVGGVAISVADSFSVIPSVFLLAASKVSHVNRSQAAGLVQANILAVDVATHSQGVSAINLFSAAAITAAAALHDHNSESPAFTQSSVLAIAKALHAHNVEVATLTGAGLLIVNDVAHSQFVEVSVLVQSGQINVNDSISAHRAGIINLIQNNTIDVTRITHGHASDAVVLSSGVILDVDSVLYANAVGEIVLTRAHVLGVVDGSHTHSSETPSLFISFSVQSDSVRHGCLSGAPTLSNETFLVVQKSINALIIEEPELAQNSFIVIDDSQHLHLADSIVIGGGSFSGRHVVDIRGGQRVVLIQKIDRIVSVEG